MADLPAGSDGLGWIVSHDVSQLLLIPGIQPASIAAAAAGDQQALAYLRFTAQHRAASPGACTLSPLDKLCVEARHSTSDRWEAALRKTSPQIVNVFNVRRLFTRQLLDSAAREGILAAIRWLRAICPDVDDSMSLELLLLAAEGGHLEVLKYMWARDDFWRQDKLFPSETAQHPECLKFLFADNYLESYWFDEDILAVVARHHGLAFLQWCRDCNLPDEWWHEGLLLAAIELGDQPMLEWLRAQDPPVPWDSTVCRKAAECGNISMLAWLQDQQPPCPWDESVTAIAAAIADGVRNISTLAWLRNQQPPCPWDESVAAAAAKTANGIETLGWLRGQAAPCPWDSQTCSAAAYSGRLDMLEWLRDQSPPCPWSPACFKAAVYRPHVEILQWLHARGCPMNEGATLTAADCGDLPTLQYLYSIGCPLHDQCPTVAVQRGRLAVLEWLYKQGCPLTEVLYIWAAQNRQSHMLRFLCSKNVPLPAPFYDWDPFAFRSIRLRHLMFLADIGMELFSEDEVTQGRKAHCTFHGLVRWCRRAVSDPSRGALRAFDSLAEDMSGQVLLSRLCLLPQELLGKIAVAADLQHDIFCSQ